jgi:hypothetical protein
VQLVLLIYVLGVAAGLLLTDGRVPTRLLLALLWPLGPLAFVVVIAGLLVASLYLFPIFGAVVAVGVAAGWWFLS